MNYGFRHIFHIHRMRKELKEVYANQMIDKFAHSTVMVFIPIYLLLIGYSLAESLLVLLVSELITVFIAIPVASLAARVGLKHMILYRIPFAILFVFWLEALPFLGLSLTNIVIVGAIWGTSRTLYWVPLNSEFVENSDKTHRGEEVGFLLALPIIVSIGSPLMGGLILEFLGFYILFSLFIIMMVFSVVPFFLTKEYRKYFKFKLKDVSLRLGNRFNMAFFAQGFFMIGDYILWPLYAYLVFESVVFTGIVASLTALGTAFLILLIGRVCDRIKRDKMLKLGAIGCFFVWVLKYFAVTSMEFFILSFIGGVFTVLVSISLFASFSDNAKERNILNDVSVREIFLSIGRVATISIIAFSLISFQLGLIAMAILCLPLLFVNIKSGVPLARS